MSISRTRISFALLLIGLGIWQLAVNVSPNVRALSYGLDTWPLNVVALGAFMLLLGLITWTPGWFVPACIVGGIGGLLYYQNLSGDWESWAYAWTLIPGFVGIGLLLLGLAKWRRGPIIGAGWTIFSSLMLFGIFGYALGGISMAGAAAAVAVILLGIMFLITPLLRRSRTPKINEQ